MVRSKEETEAVGERGLAIYESDIAPQLTDNDRGTIRGDRCQHGEMGD